MSQPRYAILVPDCAPGPPRPIAAHLTVRLFLSDRDEGVAGRNRRGKCFPNNEGSLICLGGKSMIFHVYPSPYIWLLVTWCRAHYRGAVKAAEEEADVAIWRGVGTCVMLNMFFKTSSSVTSKIAFVALPYTHFDTYSLLKNILYFVQISICCINK